MKKCNLEELEASDPVATTNSWNPSHIIRNSHIKALFFLVCITWYSMSGFQQKNYKAFKKTRKNTVKLIIRIRLR